MPRLLPCLLAPIFVISALTAPAPALAQTRTYEIQPSSIDGSVHNFDAPYLVIPNVTTHEAPLVVFLTGAGGKPTGAADFLKFVASQGYPVIALEYNDDPAVAQICPANPDPDCSEAFRRMRMDSSTDGPGTSPVTNPPNESIIGRLTILLRTLTMDKPGEGWDYYLDGDNIRWDHIVISGLSDGAGMAAHIAKHYAVARVVLFSSPLDITGPDRQPAAWLTLPPVTPKDRWFAEYDPRDATAGPIKTGYTALQIPADHIRAVGQDSQTDVRGNASTPFAASALRDARLASDLTGLFGKPGPAGTVQ